MSGPRGFSPGRILLLLVSLASVPGRVGAAEPEFPFNPVPREVSVPAVPDPEWATQPVDAFVFARLAAAGLQPAPEVDRPTFARRVALDLTGLPPTPQEIAEFVSDRRPDSEAREAFVDRYLASPHYGERMARLWLDVVRYADTDGFAIDGERPTLWRYRDYVVRSFNNDKPFDQFAREQLAGDLMGQTPEGLIATGFYRLGPWEADNMTPEHRRQDFLNEMTSAIGSAFLGLTLGCARCHDHKYDPLPAADYYRLQAFLTPEDRGEKPAEFLPDEQTAAFLRGKADADRELERARSEFELILTDLRQRLAPSVGKPPAEITAELIEEEFEKKNELLKEEDGKRFFEGRKKLQQNIGQRFQSQVVTLKRLPADQVAAARVLRNGDPFDPADEVAPGFLSAVAPWESPIFGDSSGTAPEQARLRLAEWVASPHNPLTSRVFVNRIWQQLFGQGLVPTSNDFGAAGSGVSHRELLDFLARDFLAGGFRVKRLQRQLLLSRAYRSSTAHPRADECARVDADNRLGWRAPFRRLDAEGVRDALLAVSGRLNREVGGPGFFEALPDGVETKYEFFDWPVSSPEERRRRSLYMFQRRNLVHPLMEVFDVADANQPCERRRPSVTAPQILTLLNGAPGQEGGAALAERLRREAGADPTAQIELAYQLVYCRPPVTIERELCLQFLTADAEPAVPTAPPGGTGTEAAAAASPVDRLTRLCLVLLNANEFLYLD